MADHISLELSTPPSDPPRLSLLGMPPEIRTKIWRYVFTHIPHGGDDPRASHIDIVNAYMPIMRYSNMQWVKAPTVAEIVDLADKREKTPPYKYEAMPVMSVSHQRNHNDHSVLRLITLNRQIYRETWALFYELNTLLFSNRASLLTFARYAPSHIKEVVQRVVCVHNIEQHYFEDGVVATFDLPSVLGGFVSLDRLHFIYNFCLPFFPSPANEVPIKDCVKRCTQYIGLEHRMSCITYTAIQLEVQCDSGREHLKYDNDHPECEQYQGRNFVHDEEAYTILFDSEWWRDTTLEVGKWTAPARLRRPASKYEIAMLALRNPGKPKSLIESEARERRNFERRPFAVSKRPCTKQKPPSKVPWWFELALREGR